MLTSIVHLQPYRSRGLGSHALQSVIDAARMKENPRIARIYLHVQVSNEDARRFYERHGFVETGLAKVRTSAADVLVYVMTD